MLFAEVILFCSAPKERKRLVLKPRSKPLEENQTEEDIAAAKAAVFGGAKPVDTAAREREIEEKLLQQRQDEKRKTEHQPQHTQ